jgi:hypothetical protein
MLNMLHVSAPEAGVMRYWHAALAATIGVVMVLWGLMTRISVGLCDQCEQKQPITFLIGADLVFVLAAIISTFGIWFQRRAKRRAADDGGG